MIEMPQFFPSVVPGSSGPPWRRLVPHGPFPDDEELLRVEQLLGAQQAMQQEMPTAMPGGMEMPAPMNPMGGQESLMLRSSRSGGGGGYGEARRALKEFDAEASKLGKMGGELAAANQAEVAAHAGLEAKMREEADKAERQHARQAEAMGAAIAQYQDAQKTLSTLKVNPNRLYQNVGFTVGSAIALALGGLAEGVSGGRVKSSAMDMINGALNRDLMAQQADYNRLKDTVNGKYTLIGILRKKGQDEATAMSTARLLGLDAAKVKIEAAAAASKLPKQQIELQAMLVDVKKQKAQEIFKIADAENQREMHREELEFRREQAAAPKPLSKEERDAMAADLDYDSALNEMVQLSKNLEGELLPGAVTGSFVPTVGAKLIGKQNLVQFREARKKLEIETSNKIKGASSDRDAKRVSGTLPSETDGFKVAEKKFRYIRANKDLADAYGEATSMVADKSTLRAMRAQVSQAIRQSMAESNLDRRAKMMETSAARIKRSWGLE